MTRTWMPMSPPALATNGHASISRRCPQPFVPRSLTLIFGASHGPRCRRTPSGPTSAAAAVAGPRVAKLYCVDASEAALRVARRNLASFGNCEFVSASGAETPIPNASLDFAYSLGVLHHLPDTAAGLASCVRKLKPGAPFLLYLYYRFDNRPGWYRAVWSITNLARVVISRLPYGLRYWTSQLIAACVYWPAARFARLARGLGIRATHFPLQFYSDKPFYVVRTDALDR